MDLCFSDTQVVDVNFVYKKVTSLPALRPTFPYPHNSLHFPIIIIKKAAHCSIYSTSPSKMQFINLYLAAIVGFAMAAPNGELKGLHGEKRVSS